VSFEDLWPPSAATLAAGGVQLLIVGVARVVAGVWPRFATKEVAAIVWFSAALAATAMWFVVSNRTANQRKDAQEVEDVG
jgi:hypothetical protein